MSRGELINNALVTVTSEKAAAFIILIIIFLFIFVLLREMLCMYFKVNSTQKLLRENNQLLLNLNNSKK